MRKLLLCAVALALPGLCVAQMGPGMMGGGMMGPGMMGGMSGSPTDMNPVWSPDGQSIAFTQATVGATGVTGSAKGGVQRAVAGGGATFVNNLRPLSWTPDGSGIICGLDSPANQTSPYSGFWMVGAGSPSDATGIHLICRAQVALQADYSPDGRMVLYVDERATDLHEVLVGAAGANPKSVYIARDGEKLLQAGWTNDSGYFWVLAEVSTKASVQPGDAIPEDALKASAAGGMMGPGMMGGGMMGPGMMGGGMMGPGMMGGGGMMGPGMMGGMMGGAAVPQAKKVLFRFRADGSGKEQVCADAEDIEAAAWCPTQSLVAVVRKVAKAATAGAGMGGMMGPGMMGGGGGGMMGPGMMGGGGGGMMGPGMMGGMMGGGASTFEEYLAVRAPDKDAAETRVADPSVPIRSPQWSKDGRLLCGTNADQARVFVVAPPGPPITEVAQNFDDAVKGPRAASFSPNGRMLAYSGAIDVKDGDSKSISRGLFVVDLDTGKTTQLTANKSAAPTGMMGGGMMGPGMMGGGMMGPGMMGPGMMGGGVR